MGTIPKKLNEIDIAACSVYHAPQFRLRRELPCTRVNQFYLRRELPAPGTKGGLFFICENCVESVGTP